MDKIEFIHIPKNAGTTILTHLSALDSVRFNPDREHFTANQKKASDPVKWESMSTFAIVRNPYERMMSIWRYEVKQSVISKSDIETYNNIKNFDDWLAIRHCSLDWGRAHMLLPQWFWVSDWIDHILVKNIFRYEQIDNCFDFIQDITGLSIDRSLHLNSSFSSSSYKEVSKKSQEIMRDLCKIDCLKFGYDW